MFFFLLFNKNFIDKERRHVFTNQIGLGLFFFFLIHVLYVMKKDAAFRIIHFCQSNLEK